MSYLYKINVINRHNFNFSLPNSQIFATKCHISDFGVNFARTEVCYGIYVKTEHRKEV